MRRGDPMCRSVPFGAMFLLLLAGPAAAQTISGVVRAAPSGDPVDGATVTAQLPGSVRTGSVETNAAGEFVVRAWRAGTFRLEVRHPSYPPAAVVVDAGFGERVEVEVTLGAVVATLDAIVVRARSQPLLPESGLGGFDERRRWGELLGNGRFLDAADLQRGGTLHGALSAVPGLRSVQHPTCPSARILVVGRSTFSVRSTYRGEIIDCNASRGEEEGFGICRVAFIVDGVRVRIGGAERIDDIVPLAEVAAVEVYRSPAELPGEYSGSDMRCGVVGIWTARGR
jgi:hypothetical protein